MRPHFVPLDGIDHLRSQKMPCERRIGHAHQEARKRGGQEQYECRKRVRKRLAKNSRVDVLIERPDSAAARPPSHVNQVVRASPYLIEVNGPLLTCGVFA